MQNQDSKAPVLSGNMKNKEIFAWNSLYFSACSLDLNKIYKLIFMELEASLALFLHVRHFPSDEDSDIEDENQEVDSEDLEKFNASCAAFTVVCLVCLFVSEFLLMSVYLVLFNGEFILISSDFCPDKFLRSL